jgi:hypothetical protein
LVVRVVLVVPEDPAEPKDLREHLEQVVLLRQEVQVVLHMLEALLVVTLELMHLLMLQTLFQEQAAQVVLVAQELRHRLGLPVLLGVQAVQLEFYI